MLSRRMTLLLYWNAFRSIRNNYLGTAHKTFFLMSTSHGSAIPSSLAYAPAPNGARAQQHQSTLQPTNGVTFTGSSTIRIEMPCGRKGTYLNCQQSYLSFTYEPRSGANGAAAGLGPTALPRGGASSLIESVSVYCGSNLLSRVRNYAAVRNMFRDLQCNRSDQSGAISVLEGIDSNDDRLGATVAAGAAVHAVSICARSAIPS